MGDKNLNNNPFFLRRPYCRWSSDDDDESNFIELPRVYMGLSTEDLPSMSGDGAPQPEQAEARRREAQPASGRRLSPVSVRRDLPVPAQREIAEAVAMSEQTAARRTQMQQDRDLFWQILNNTAPRSSILARSNRPVVGLSPTRSTSSLLERPGVRAAARAPEFRGSENDLMVQEQRAKKHRRDYQFGGHSLSFFSWFRSQDTRTPSFSAQPSPKHGSGLVSSTRPEPVAVSSEPVAGSSEPIARSSEPIARSSEPVAGSSEPIAGSSEPIAGSSQPIGSLPEPTAVSFEPIAGPSSEPIAGPSRPTDHKKAKKKAKEPPLSEHTMDALQEDYTRWLNRSLNGERRVHNNSQMSGQIFGQTSSQRPYQNLNQMLRQNSSQISNPLQQAMAEATEAIITTQQMPLHTPLKAPEVQLQRTPDAPRLQSHGNYVDDKHEIGQMGIDLQRDRTGDVEGETAEAKSEAARLTLDEVVVEAPEDISRPDPSAPGAEGDQPDLGDQAAALPSEQPTDAIETAPSNPGNTNANNPQRPTNLAIKSEESPQSETSNGVGGKRKRDSPDDIRRPDTVAEFNMKMLRHLECPVCLDWMEPPIAQCRRGHVVCPRCRSKLSACPVCRTSFSSVRNRAMEGVAEMLRYPCRYSCGREVGMHRRAAHEASCCMRRYRCPAHACSSSRTTMPREDLSAHFQSKHSSIIRTGVEHKFFLSVRSEVHKSFIILALDQFFHLNIDIDIHSWGAVLHVSYIGPKKLCKYFVYEVTVKGMGAFRKLVYVRNTHSDLDKLSLSAASQDRFHLTAEQVVNYVRIDKNNTEKYMAFSLELNQLRDLDELDEDSD